MKKVYIAHPLGSDPAGRQNNCDRATMWFMWAADQGVCPIASWILLARYWPETRRDDGLAIDFACIEACDEVWLCGPTLSPGMKAESEYAAAIGKVVRHFPEMRV